MTTETTKNKSWYEVLVALTPLILGLCVTGVGLFFTQIYNYRQLQLSQLSALDKFRESLVSENAVEREFAYASFAALGYEQLALRIIQVKRDSAGRSVVQEIQLSGNPSVKAEAKATLSELPFQVFLHIGSEIQRDKAKEASAALQQAGYMVAGIENTAGKAESPQTTEVRFFNDADKSTAEAIAETLRTRGLANARATKVSLFKVKPGSLELWLAAEASESAVAP